MPVRWMIVVASLLAAGAQAGILGKKPDYLPQAATEFPNAEAVTPRIWAPGLDEGYAPQGLAIEGRRFVVSAYQDGDPARPACRVFAIDRETGAAQGAFDMPPACHHAGGIVAIGNGQVVVADTKQLWRVAVDAALKAGRVEDGLRGSVALAGALAGSFTFFDGKDLWIGTYTVTKDAAKAKVHRLALAIFDELDGSAVGEERVLETLAIPPLGQGAALDAERNLWIAASTSKIGILYRLDRASGATLARYDTVNGIEGIVFDGARLWAISEAGARKYMGWPRHFPLIFEIDVSRLK